MSCGGLYLCDILTMSNNPTLEHEMVTIAHRYRRCSAWLRDASDRAPDKYSRRIPVLQRRLQQTYNHILNARLFANNTERNHLHRDMIDLLDSIQTWCMHIKRPQTDERTSAACMIHDRVLVALNMFNGLYECAPDDRKVDMDNRLERIKFVYSQFKSAEVRSMARLHNSDFRVESSKGDWLTAMCTRIEDRLDKFEYWCESLSIEFTAKHAIVHKSIWSSFVKYLKIMCISCCR